MPRLTPASPDHAAGPLADLFASVQQKVGRVPNMMRTMGAAPVVLEAYLSFTKALGKGRLPAKLGELLALAVAEANGCQYCLAAHTAIVTQRLRLPAATALAARAGHGIDAKTDAALAFARALVSARGQRAGAGGARRGL